jgi:hypothetical protein
MIGPSLTEECCYIRLGQVGGYRDLMLCCLLEGPTGLKIIGEIQVMPSA